MNRMQWLPVIILTSIAGTSASAAGTTRQADAAYIEFLWSRTPQGALARQETRSFALDGRFDHQVCVAVLDDALVVKQMTVQALDPSGSVISSQTHPRENGEKKCFSAVLPRHAAPGKWTYRVLINDGMHRIGERSLDVHATVDALVAATPKDMPYVLGRPNYDAAIPPADYNGELTWIMQIKPDGSVDNVEIERADGIGVRMQPRALAAGRLSLFPPDPERVADATYRRTLSFRPDK